MSKKKAIICTSLFAVVLIGVIIGTMFVRSEFVSLYEILVNFVFMVYVSKQIRNFYDWLQEE